MLQDYIQINRILRKIVYFAWDAMQPAVEDETISYISNYVEKEILAASHNWWKFPLGISYRSCS